MSAPLPALWRKPSSGRTIVLALGSTHETAAGALTIIATAPSLGTGARYRVRCEAGHERVLRGVDIRNGRSGICHACKAERAVDPEPSPFQQEVNKLAAEGHARIAAGITDPATGKLRKEAAR